MIGCGSGTSDTSSNPTEEDLKDINMSIGQEYTVFPQNKVVKYSPNALIKISHAENSLESIVILLSGSATILRNPIE